MQESSPAEIAVDPRRYFESVSARARHRGAQAGLPLSGDDEPLQPAVHDLPAHLRGARAARRHELGAVPLDRRSGARHRTRGPARRRRADAGQESAEDGALPEGAGHLRPVQHQRHGAQREERPGADRSRARRAARLARRGQRQILSRRSRQGLLRPHPAERAGVPRAAGARGQSIGRGSRPGSPA